MLQLVALTKHREAIAQALRAATTEIETLLTEGLAARPEAQMLLLMGSIPHKPAADCAIPFPPPQHSAGRTPFRTYGLTLEAQTNQVLLVDVRGLTHPDCLEGDGREVFCRPFEALTTTELYSLVCTLSFHNYCWTTIAEAETEAQKYPQG